MRVEEAAALFNSLCAAGKDAQIAFFKDAPLQHDSINLLLGFRQAILERAKTCTLGGPALDLCGTGGDRKNTINISTLCAIVTRSFGVPVCKHGNTGASSPVGSTDFLKLLGIPLPETPEQAQEFFEAKNIVFLHAPFFHPDLKHFREARKEFGKPTVFNLLGPLCNPATPTHHFVGAFPKEAYELYRRLTPSLTTKLRVVHALDGYDEISGTGSFIICDDTGEAQYDIREFLDAPIDPALLQRDCTSLDTRRSGAIRLLSGEDNSPLSRVIALNVAFAVSLYSGEKDIKLLFHKACSHIASGAPNSFLKELAKA